MGTKAQYRAGILTYFDSATLESTWPVAPVRFVDDFLGAYSVIPAAGSAESGCLWVKKIVGAAPPTVAILDDSTNGAVECALTSASEKQNAELYHNDNQQFNVLYNLVFETRFKLTTLPTGNAEAVLGMISAWADGLDSATYSAFVTCDGSGEIICESDDNVTDASATSGVTLTTSDWAIARIEYATSGEIKFFINGVRVAASTSFSWAASEANSKVQPITGLYKASGTGVGTMLVDYVKVWQNRSL